MNDGLLKTKSPALKKLIELCKVPEETEFIFYHECELGEDPVKKGERFVQNIRVQLSRLRGIARDQGKVPRPWKIFTIEISKHNDTSAKIILKRGRSKDDVSDKVDEIFNLVGVSEKIQ